MTPRKQKPARRSIAGRFRDGYVVLVPLADSDIADRLELFVLPKGIRCLTDTNARTTGSAVTLPWRYVIAALAARPKKRRAK